MIPRLRSGDPSLDGFGRCIRKISIQREYLYDSKMNKIVAPTQRLLLQPALEKEKFTLDRVGKIRDTVKISAVSYGH